MSDELRDSWGQTKVVGKHHVHPERSEHIFGACRCVKLWSGLLGWKGLGAAGLSPGVALRKRSHSTDPDNPVSNVKQHSFSKNQNLLCLLDVERLLSVFPVVSHTPLCLISLLFSERGFTGGFCIISFRCTPSLSVCACLSTCLVVQTNMINEAIGVSRMSCDQRAFDVWHF